MEKIYMEEYNQKKKKNVSFSVILSFAVAIFAIASLAIVGFNQISYAAPTPYVEDTLTFNIAGGENPIYFVADAGAAIGRFNVPVYLAGSTDFTSGTPIFCVEHFADISNGSTYTKSSEIVSDPGLIYILSKSGVLGGKGIYSSDMTKMENRYIETYSTQVAIWVYLYEKYYSVDQTKFVKYSLAGFDKDHPNDNPAEASDHYNAIKNATSLSVNSVTGESLSYNIPTLYTEKIGPLIEEAKTSGVITKSLTINGSTTISKVGDDSFYQTSQLSVSSSPANDLLSYVVSVSGIDGAIVVDADGNEKYQYNAGDKFFVRIPVNKVTSNVASVNVHVNATVQNYLTASYFINGDFQKVILVTSDQGNIETDRSIQIVGTPNTGMNKAQTIYFIGLVVLLCGIGIIYANSKHADFEE